MICRLLRLLLVPLLLANQGLCLGHVHPGGEIVEPEGHASRPHFHLGGHHGASHHHRHAGHSHDEPATDADQQETDQQETDQLDAEQQQDADQQDAGFAAALTTADQHDADVVFFTGPCASTREIGSAGVAWTKSVATISPGTLVGHRDRLLRGGTGRGQPVSVFDAACPIYLRALCLRI